MTQEIERLKAAADDARSLYRTGRITRSEARKRIAPYEEAFNQKARELAKKYSQKPKTFSFSSYLR